MALNNLQKHEVEIRHFHLFCGLGGGAIGFNQGEARVGTMQAKFRCLGGVDVDAGAIKDFTSLVGVPGTVLDLFSREQYKAFHGREPSADWKEATSVDIQRAAGWQKPHIIFLSAPCKGFSGLLSSARASTEKYQALNELTLRGVWLALEAWKDNPVELFIFENVPRIAIRGRHLLDQITALFRHYGYAVAETTHDCGELGGLAQSRRRFLLVARHQSKVPAYLYEPYKKPLRSVGDILSRLPLAGDIEAAGPMHRIPALQWKTWVRLAFVEAGSDWRSLNKLAVEDGYLKDFLIVPECHAGFLGVNQWNSPTGTVRGKSGPTNGNFSIADPRFSASAKWESGQAYGVRHWDESSGAITSQRSPGQGVFSVADPRMSGERHNNVYKIINMEHAAGTVTSGHGPSSGGQGVADPRPGFSKNAHTNIYRIIKFTEPSKTVIGASHPSGACGCVADPRGNGFAGKYQVTNFSSPSNTVISGSTTGQGAFAVADPREPLFMTSAMEGEWLPKENEKLVAYIQALDGTHHRPFTTAELASLQGLFCPDNDRFLLSGQSDSDWRERIGNAVPPPAAKAIASMMGETLLLAWAGETFTLSSNNLWVRSDQKGDHHIGMRQLAVALAVDTSTHDSL